MWLSQILLSVKKCLCMKKFLFRIFAFFIFIISIFILLAYLPPYYWGSPSFGGKIKYFEENKLDPDILFVGPSTVMRNIIPSQFDRLIDSDLNSFSLTADGSLPRHSKYIFENFIKKNRGKIKYVFFELESFDQFGEMRYHSTYSKYYTNIFWLFDGLKYIRNLETLDAITKRELYKKNIVSYFENFFKIGVRTDFLNSFKESSYKHFIAMNGKHKTGYMPLPKRKKQRKFLPNYLDKLLASKKKAYSGININSPYNSSLSNFYIKDIDYYLQQGIRIIYLLPPREYKLDTDSEMLQLFKSLPEGHKIDLANPFLFPEFYAIENRFDRGHLNDAGSVIYTKKLAEIFRREILLSKNLK